MWFGFRVQSTHIMMGRIGIWKLDVNMVVNGIYSGKTFGRLNALPNEDVTATAASANFWSTIRLGVMIKLQKSLEGQPEKKTEEDDNNHQLGALQKEIDNKISELEQICRLFNEKKVWTTISKGTVLNFFLANLLICRTSNWHSSFPNHLDHTLSWMLRNFQRRLVIKLFLFITSRRKTPSYSELLNVSLNS